MFRKTSDTPSIEASNEPKQSALKIELLDQKYIDGIEKIRDASIAQQKKVQQATADQATTDKVTAGQATTDQATTGQLLKSIPKALLFGTFKLNKAKPSQDLIPYMNVVDAAIYRQGSISTRLMLWGVCLTFFLLALWGSLADIEEIVHGMGKIIPAQRVQQIQNLEGGILREILVREGEEIDKGALLLRIDNEQAGSVLRDAKVKSLNLRSAIARLEAEISGLEPKFPEELHQKAPEIIQRQNNLLIGNRKKDAAERRSLEAQLDLRKLEATEQLTKKETLNSSLALAVRQRNLASKLMASRSYSEMEFLNLEQRVSSLEGELATLESTIPKTQAAIRESEERLILHKAERDSADMEELNTYTTELATLNEIIVSGGDKVTRTEVRSPVRGVIKSIKITTVGGVIMPGEVIMDIVPLDDNLIVEARIRPEDIAFIFVGQKANIKLTAYDFTIYGALEAKVEHISADTIETRDGEAFYLVKLRTINTFMLPLKENLSIKPGMMATADIITGKKTVIDYILKPILKAKQNALRER